MATASEAVPRRELGTDATPPRTSEPPLRTPPTSPTHPNPAPATPPTTPHTTPLAPALLDGLRLPLGAMQWTRSSLAAAERARVPSGRRKLPPGLGCQGSRPPPCSVLCLAAARHPTQQHSYWTQANSTVPCLWRDSDIWDFSKLPMAMGHSRKLCSLIVNYN